MPAWVVWINAEFEGVVPTMLTAFFALKEKLELSELCRIAACTWKSVLSCQNCNAHFQFKQPSASAPPATSCFKVVLP